MIVDLRAENWTQGLAITKHWFAIIGTCMALCVRADMSVK